MCSHIVRIENAIDDDGFRLVHFMSGEHFDEYRALLPDELPDHVELETYNDAVGMFHVKGRWPYNGPISFRYPPHPNDPEERFWKRELYLQHITGTLREAIDVAVDGYWKHFGKAPGYAFVPVLPQGAENLMEMESGIILVKAGFAMPEKCVAIAAQ